MEVSAVSADVSSHGVLGTQRLKSVSGEITADVAGDDSEVRSVSGDVTVHGSGKPISLRVSSVSGSLDLTDGAGKLDVVTVSGDARVQMGEASEVRGRTTSGDLELRAKLTADGRVDVEGVSGDLTLRLPSPGALSHRNRILQRRHHRLPRRPTSSMSASTDPACGSTSAPSKTARGCAPRRSSGDIEICDK